MEQALIPKTLREKTKYCFECGICTASCPMVELLHPNYNARSLLLAALTEPEALLNEDSIWLCAWCYSCYKKCPQNLKLPEIFQIIKNEAAKRDSFNGLASAAEIMKNNVPLPEICWYTCFHPERANIQKSKLTNVFDKLSIRHKRKRNKRTALRGEKVAIIGSGPAGLTAAFELSEEGYQVTVFEALSAAGGMLRKAMPQYRLPKEALEAEIKHLKSSGVNLVINTEIGKDLEFNELWQSGFKAVFVAVGAHKTRKLGIEGEGLKNVVDALDFLWKPDDHKKAMSHKKVGIIGGGNVAIDAARTALRQGAEEVIVLYRRSSSEVPANPWEVKEASKEGVKFRFLVAPKKILGKEGKAFGLECVEVKLGEVDESGRKKPLLVDGSEFSLNFDTIVVAIGETVEASFLPKEVEFEMDNRILANPITLETTMEGVFAGGDAVTGPATVIEAVLAGKRAAHSIKAYLKTVRKKGKK